MPRIRGSFPTLKAAAAAIWLCAHPQVLAAAGNVCDRAATRASEDIGVPLDILMAISRAETGRTIDNQFQPWPWTTNDAGKGTWFETREQAQAHVNRQHSLGMKNFDIGCYQINVRWHGEQFSSIEDMLDPETNARYAARFLKELMDEKGNWEDAVAAYHSRTPEHAERYRKRFSRILAGLTRSEAKPHSNQEHDERKSDTDNLIARVNTFPLITPHSNQAASLGSLVSLPNRTRTALIVFEGG